MRADPASLGPLDISPADFDWAQFSRLAKGQPWRGRNAVITGGTGFIGARLARKLAIYGASVTIPTRDRRQARKQVHPNIRLIFWNPSSQASVSSAIAGADTLFNLAYDFRRSGEANLALYRAIADAAAKQGVRRFIHASSIAVYDGWPTEDLSEDSPCDGPGHPYKMAKRAMERDLQERVRKGDFDAAIIQPVNVYGPFSAMWTDAIVERIRGSGIVLPCEFDGLNNGVYVDDLVDAFIAAGDLQNVGARRFIVAGPAPIPWLRMFSAYAEACDGAVEIENWRPSGVPQQAAGAAATLKRRLHSLVMRAGALLAAQIGAARVMALRTRLARNRGGGGQPYRPVQEDPHFFLSRAVVDAARAARELCPPVTDTEEGLSRTKDYVAWRLRVTAC
ncbi:MAG: NAD-dependent epimerase/dehydratase family protein [Sphingomonas sp.]|nr:NAD-dependent epimerase/dehydratase family protein [Sphingomonas sp.]